MKRFVFSFAAVAALLALSGTARADLQIAVSDGAGDSVTYTNGAVSSSSGVFTPGTIVYDPTPGAQVQSVSLASFGKVSFANTTTESNSPGIPTGLSELTSSITSLRNNGAAPAVITLAYSGNNFLASNYAGDPFIKVTESLTNLGGTFPGTVHDTSYIDSANHLTMPNGVALPTLSVTGLGTATFSDSSVPTGILGVSKFSLGQVIHLTLGAHQSVSLTMNTTITPEPATLLAWGCGLGLIGLVRRRRTATVA